MSSNYFYTQSSDNGYVQTLEKGSGYHPEIIYSPPQTNPTPPVQVVATPPPPIVINTAGTSSISSPDFDSTVASALSNYTLNIKTILNSIFNDSDFIYLLWFLAIYLLIFFIIGIMNTQEIPYTTAQIIDFTILFIVIIISIIYYYSLPNNEKKEFIRNLWVWTEEFFENPVTLFSMILFLMIFYLAIYLFEIYFSSVKQSHILRLIEHKVVTVIIIVIIIDIFKYVFGISLINLLNKFLSYFWDNLPDDTVPQNTIMSQAPAAAPQPKNEVFNISNNLYTYDDAQAICKSYGARMATYDDIEQAYNDGAEWCNYGWSDNQMAFFPTQKSTWNKLQKDEKTKNNCGRPGVNGGFMANPYLKFGVNCFGQKPAPSQEDLERLKQQNQPLPENPQDTVVDKKVQFWKENADKLLVINSFNNDKWSEY